MSRRPGQCGYFDCPLVTVSPDTECKHQISCLQARSQAPANSRNCWPLLPLQLRLGAAHRGHEGGHQRQTGRRILLQEWLSPWLVARVARRCWGENWHFSSWPRVTLLISRSPSLCPSPTDAVQTPRSRVLAPTIGSAMSKDVTGRRTAPDCLARRSPGTRRRDASLQPLLLLHYPPLPSQPPQQVHGDKDDRSKGYPQKSILEKWQ